MATEPLEIGEDKTLLLVDDDEPFLKRLAKAMEKRGFSPSPSQAASETVRHHLPKAKFCLVQFRAVRLP